MGRTATSLSPLRSRLSPVDPAFADATSKIPKSKTPK
jgi:hypothetical protein